MIAQKPFQFLSFIVVLFVFLAGNTMNAQSKWEKYHEDKNVLIEYQLSDCVDKVNDVAFSYYLIKVTNKKSKSLNVQYNFAPNAPWEYNYSYVLGPNESVEGRCEASKLHLKKYVDRNDPSKSFILYNFKVYEF